MPDSSSYAQTTLTKVSENIYRSVSSGVYYALVKKTGKQIKRSMKTRDPQLARRRLREFQEQIEKVELQSGRTHVTFDETAARWLEVLKPTMKPSSHLRKVTCVKALKKHFEGKRICTITRRMCEDWAVIRAPQRAASTFNYEKEALFNILQYAIREGIILDNPARSLKRKKLLKKELIIPTQEQFAKLISHLRSLTIRHQEAANLLELLAYSGMRKGEANAFRWGDVHWKRKHFVVSGGEFGTKNYEARTVPLFPALASFLKRLQKVRNSVNPKDLFVPIESAKSALSTACRDLELAHFTHHSMRHYFVSNAIEKGVDFKTIAAWVGHKDGGLLVAKTYGHLRDTHSMEMAKLITAP
ncbi:MAG: tyrosine-type recombinase/integrase [Puniceicoccaceae bacterium]